MCLHYKEKLKKRKFFLFLINKLILYIIYICKQVKRKKKFSYFFLLIYKKIKNKKTYIYLIINLYIYTWTKLVNSQLSNNILLWRNILSGI